MVFRIKRLHRCANCGWFRDIADDPRLMQERVLHPIYGNVSVGGVAKLDVINHNCKEHKAAVERIREYARFYPNHRNVAATADRGIQEASI